MLRSHKYLWLAGILLFVLFLGYVFWHDHKHSISDDFQWVEKFLRVGVDPKDITHDESVWYYKRRSTCVGYGDWKDECPKHESYCAGERIFGDANAQVDAIKKALERGGVHPECPLVYAGAE